MREFVYTVAAVVVAVAVAAFLLVSVVGIGTLWIAGVLFLALAAFLFLWDFEKDEVFKDDWIEIAQVTASVVFGVTGSIFLVAHFVA